jgi:hypothetical protein
MSPIKGFSLPRTPGGGSRLVPIPSWRHVVNALTAA